MSAQAKLKVIRLMVLAVFFLAPSVFAQEKTAPAKTETEQAKTEPKTEAKTEATSEAKPETQSEEDRKRALGMSILGNQEAPKALVIVPWKRSELGNTFDISTMLDDSRQPVDKDVFMRMLSYFEIRSGSANAAVPAKNNAPQPATTQRRKP